MKLSELLSEIPIINKTCLDLGADIVAVEKDSRKAGPNVLFVALRGAKQDGHDFILQAAARSPAAIVYDRKDAVIPAGCAGIYVADSHVFYSEALKRFYGFQEGRPQLLGVTGTNGKTTIAQLLYRLLAARKKAGYIGTLAYELPSGKRESPNTTPGPETLIPLLVEMASQGAEYAAMEVSSHALHQRRVSGLRFELAIFTQLTQDHLDYHRDMEDYFQAKRRLFAEYAPKHMLINCDCPYGRRLLAEFPQARSFSVGGPADYSAVPVTESMAGCIFDLRFCGKSERFEIKLPLHYNISNCTAVLSGLDMLGLDIRDFAAPLAAIPFIDGRMERVPHPSADIFVDYAHTPDAFVQVLKHVKMQNPRRIVTVFGCGGDRDRGKRPQMARAAADYSDVVILTADNPRTEKPEAILDDMRAGLNEADRKRIQIIENLDRAAAIQCAVRMAQKGDAVLILGKGHEDYQIVGSEKRHFSDREQALAAQQA